MYKLFILNLNLIISYCLDLFAHLNNNMQTCLFDIRGFNLGMSISCARFIMLYKL